MLAESTGVKGPAIIAIGAGSVFAGLLQAIGTSPSPVTVVTGVLSGITVFLFTMFIRQGHRLAQLVGEAAKATDVAALDAYSRRNKEDIDRLEAEVRTIDKRDADSRHLVKNEVSPVIADVELRIMQRFEEARLMTVSVEERLGMRLREVREEQVKVSERLSRHIETGQQP